MSTLSRIVVVVWICASLGMGFAVAWSVLTMTLTPFCIGGAAFLIVSLLCGLTIYLNQAADAEAIANTPPARSKSQRLLSIEELDRR